MKIRYPFLLLFLCLLPVTALAAIVPSEGVERNGTIITLSGEYEEYSISGPEENVSIIVESGVKSLILHGAGITAPEGQDALMAEGSLQLHVIDANMITGGSSYIDGGRGIVLPQDGKLTITGTGSLKVNGGDTLYEGNAAAKDGKGGAAIVGSVLLQADVHVTVTGGSCHSGYDEGFTSGGHGVVGDVEINGGQLNATGGASNLAQYNSGGNGITGNAIVNSGQVIAIGGAASGGQHTYRISNSGGHGVSGNAEVNGGSLTATGGQASKGIHTIINESYNQAGHGVNGNAVVNSGQLTVRGGTALDSPKKNFGGNGVSGAFTAAGGYALVIGGAGDADRMGKAAASTDGSSVIIGSSGKFLSASAGEDSSPKEPLNEGKLYTEETYVTDKVSGKRSIETKEHFVVTYSCAHDGCENTYTDYAEGSKTYTVKTPESLGFQNHDLTFAGFVDINGNAVDSLTVSGPISLKASWKVVFTFDMGEGGKDSVPPIGAITSGNTVRLPECGIAAPAGYRFAGWKINGDDKIYAVGDEVPAAREIHLTAVWKPISVLPATGDSSMPMLWTLLCLGSCAMLLLLRVKARN